MSKVFLKNISSLTLIQLANTVIPLLLIPYLARIISPEHFGELEFARYFCYFFTVIVNYGFDVTATRIISNKRENKTFVSYLSNQVYYAKLVLLLLSFFIFVVLVHNHIRWKEIQLLLYTTFAINIGFFLFPLWFFQGMEKLIRISFINLIAKIIIAGLIIVLIKKDSDYWIFNALQSLALILVGIYSYFLMKKYINFKILSPSFPTIKKIILQATPIFVSTILITIPSLIYFLLIEEKGTASDLASYSTANKLIISIQALLLIPFSQAFFPMISKQVNESIEKFKKNINYSVWVVTIICLGVGGFIFIFSGTIIEVFFGREYLPAKKSLQILGFLPLVSILANIYVFQGLLSLKKDKIFMKIYFFAILFNLLLCSYVYRNVSSELLCFIRVLGELFVLLAGFYCFKKAIKKIPL